MRTWEKPELYVEEFELSQHVAAGCGTDVNITVTPGSTTKVVVRCASEYGNDGGQGHYYQEYNVEDTNKNGKIDWDEFVASGAVAENGNITGKGHSNHRPVVVIPGRPGEFDTTAKPFTS